MRPRLGDERQFVGELAVERRVGDVAAPPVSQSSVTVSMSRPSVSRIAAAEALPSGASSIVPAGSTATATPRGNAWVDPAAP